MGNKTKILLFLITAILVFFSLNQGKENPYINIASSLPLSGHSQEIGKAVVSGSQAYFSHINENGGIKNKKIKLTYLDDKYEPEITFNNVTKLLKKEDLFMFYSFVGTPTVKKILPIIQESEIPFIAPFTGGQFIREKKIDNVINFRKSYADEVEAIINYLTKTQKATKFAILYQNDDYGEEGYLATINSLEKRNLQLCAEGSYRRNTLSVNQALLEIGQNSPDVIILVGAYKPNAHFIKKARQLGIDSTFGILSFSDADATIKELNYKTENIIFSQVVPSYTDTKNPQVLEYKKLMKKYKPEVPLGFVSLESFLSAKAVVEALKKGLKVSQKNFLRSLQKDMDKDPASSVFENIYLFQYEQSGFKEIKL